MRQEILSLGGQTYRVREMSARAYADYLAELEAVEKLGAGEARETVENAARIVAACASFKVQNDESEGWRALSLGVVWELSRRELFALAERAFAVNGDADPLATPSASSTGSP